jgi:hypothetical protein
LLKIGYSVKVPTERVDELFTTGVPEPFKLAYYWAVSSLKCNTGLQAHDFASEDLGGGLESKAFSRAVV